MESVCAFIVNIIVLNFIIKVLMVLDVNRCRISFSPVISSLALKVEGDICAGLPGRLGNSYSGLVPVMPLNHWQIVLLWGNSCN